MKRLHTRSHPNYPDAWGLWCNAFSNAMAVASFATSCANPATAGHLDATICRSILAAQTLSRLRSSPLATPSALACCLIAAALVTSCEFAYRPPMAKVHRELEAVPFAGQEPACIEVHLRNGHVLVQDGDILEGDLNVEVWADDMREAEQRARSVELVRPAIEDGVCQLRVTHALGASLDDMHVRYRLRVPARIKVRVFTRSAQVAVRGYRGDIEVYTESGEIEARLAGGSCKLVSSSGLVRLGGTFSSADISADTGDVEVTLSPTAIVDLAARAETGRLLVEMTDACRMWLDFTTENGALDTDFPVFWRDSGPTDDRNARHFVGSVGDAEQPELVKANVVCGRAKFVLRRL